MENSENIAFSQVQILEIRRFHYREDVEVHIVHMYFDSSISRPFLFYILNNFVCSDGKEVYWDCYDDDIKRC